MSAQQQDAYQIRLDVKNQTLISNGQRIQLAPKAFAVLDYLRTHVDQLVTKDELLNAVWSQVYVGDAVLKVAVREIRQALQDTPRTPRYIETVHRRGYRFIGKLPVANSPNKASSTITSNAAENIQPRTIDLPDRTTELTALNDCWNKVISLPQRQIIFISGEAGIGKSTLIETWLENLIAPQQQELLYAKGQCLEQHSGSEAYQPVLEALGRLCNRPHSESVQVLLAQHAPTWFYQLPWLHDQQARERLQEELFGTTRERMLRELAVFLEVLSLPLILVLEDVHWSDNATADLLAYLAWRDEPARLLLLATVRPGELEQHKHPLRQTRQELLLKGKCQELTLGLLSQAAVNDYLLQRFANHDLAKQLAPQLYQLSDGQPLFLHSAVEHLINSGRLHQETRDNNTEWHFDSSPNEHHENLDSIDIPPDLQQMLEQQLHRLDTTTRRILSCASVAGKEFSAAAVAAVLNIDVIEVEDYCELLVRQGQWLQDADSATWPDGTLAERYRFAHHLYRRCCYESLSAARRQRYHQQYAERLITAYSNAEQRREVAAELAYHYEQSRNFNAAINYLQQAAKIDNNRLAPFAAAQKLDHALHLLAQLEHNNHADLYTKLLKRRSEFYLVNARLDLALAGYQELEQYANRQGDTANITHALLGQGHALFWINREQCLQAAERALAASEQQQDVLLHAHTQGWCVHWQAVIRGYEAHHDAAYEQAVTVAHQAGAEDLECQHLALHSYLLTLRSHYNQACDVASQGLQLAKQLGDGSRYLVCQFFHAWGLYYAGRWGEMNQVIDDGLLMATKNGHLLWVTHFRLQQAWLKAHAGDYDAAIMFCNPLLEQLRTKGLFSSQYFLALILLARAKLGSNQLQQAWQCLQEIEQRLQQAPKSIDWVLRLHLQLVLSEYWLMQKDWQQAKAASEALAALAAGPMERTHYGLAQALLVEIALAQEKVDYSLAEQALRAGEQALQGYSVPLAEWRLCHAGSHYMATAGKHEKAQAYQDKAKSILLLLERSLPDTFMQKPLAGNILTSST